ncbi:synaptobrevin-like [Saccostrea echinata]|uniref:synaptobrevin-like n=1 Tax=Saccostrea echinata TaxID=191078 RepID=UPI002A8202CC|nr:synaptobrevin-like [Saccostrea echinata]
MAKSKSKRIHVFKHFKKKKDKPETTREIQEKVPLKTVEELHQEVEGVALAMKDNIVKIRDREGKLEHLVEQGERLEAGAIQFSVMTKKAHRKMWLRAHRRSLILGGLLTFIVLVILITIIVIVLWKTGVILKD